MIKPAFIALTTAGFLSFCDTAEERAESHFQSGVELLEQGDVDRALVEFRNVFKLNGTHREARLRYAEVQRERGNLQEAYGQYRRLVEQYPTSLAGQRALAEMSVDAGNWEAAERHGAAAAELDPDDPLIQAINAAVAYRKALADDDSQARRDAVQKAKELISENPDLLIARRVLVDDLIRKENWTGALSQLDAAISSAPDQPELYTLRLGLLNQLGETQEIRAQLEDMITRFPEDPTIPATLVRWYMSQGNLDAAENFLKKQANSEPREIDAIVTYIRFFSETHGLQAALSELETVIASNPPGMERLVALREGFRFDLGERAAAVAQMEDLIEGMEPSDQRRSIMVMQARMLEATGNDVGARGLVEEVLQEDPEQTDALKMRAGWLIENDRTDDAIVALRTVLGQAPQDAAAMTLMAKAHQRAGNRDLMSDMLSRAVEASRNAPKESARYARVLIADEKLRSAESILINALRLAPDNTELLALLGDIYMTEQDWPRLVQVIESLRNQKTETSQRVADELKARQLAAQEREDELMGFLDTLASEGSDRLAAAAAIVRSRLSNGDIEGALEYAQKTLQQNPGDVNARFLVAWVQAAKGNLTQAEAEFRDLTEIAPKDTRLWVVLYNLYAMQEDEQKARQAVLDGLENLPDNFRLNWMLAGLLEKEGDIDGAIGIYEKLYAINSNDVIVANNLASLLSTTHEDEASLDRAYQIARRLRDLDFPAFQDTYGWIAFRRGDFETALASLEPAAEGLPNDPRVQYHLGRTYAALNRDEEALAQFEKAVETLGKSADPELRKDLQAEIQRLENSLSDRDTQN